MRCLFLAVCVFFFKLAERMGIPRLFAKYILGIHTVESASSEG